MITRATRLHELRLTRRAFTLGGIMGTISLGLMGRLYYLQVMEGQQYIRLSNLNKYDFRILPPSRGRILDYKGRLLAGNSEAYELSISPINRDNLDKTLRRLMNLIELDEEQYQEIMTEAEGNPPFQPVQIRADLSHREVARVVIRSTELPGVNFERVEKRIYPQGIFSGHLTGYINKASKDEVASGTISRELKNLNTGKSGVEKAFEYQLRGLPGRKRILVNAVGRPIRTLIDEEPASGRDITLNVNLDVQHFALETLKKGKKTPLALSSPRVQSALSADDELRRILADGQSTAFEDSRGRVVAPEAGAVVAMDVQTGAVKTLVSSPTVDPNLFSGRLSPSDWSKMTNNPQTPLLNRSLTGLYSPGSTFKMVVALAALEAGVINENTTFFCPGHKTIGDTDFHCWRKNGHGNMNVLTGIEQSCDVYFYSVGLKVGVKRIADMAYRLGLGDITGIQLPDEKQGLIPTKDWKRKVYGQPWTLGETANVSIGQGYVLTTPLQLAVMTARIANGEKAVTPKLTNHELGEENFADLNIPSGALKLVRAGMRRVMNGGGGTARQHDLSDVPMAGKTGTVQVRAISQEERERGIIANADRPWKFRDHALFVGYAPYDKPRYAVAVVVEHGGGGSSVAAPIASRVVDYLFKAEL
jgi:penicillin-binding protein 2